MIRHLLGFICICVLIGTSLPAHAAPAGVLEGGPDATLAEVLKDVEAKRLADAQQRLDALLQVYPNFRLAHLIRGDLLLARTRPLEGFGSAGAAPDRVRELRDEAVARLKAYHERPQPQFVPRALLQLTDQQKYAVMVDTRRSRLYLFRNDRGRPRFVADYYVTHGKEGSEKQREGDKKTPVGVYQVMGSVPRSRLSDFYGSGAFPIDYPNAWDRLHGRTGHGIWLHGVPSNTYARPPRASDGCVVLANADLDALSAYLEAGQTPVIISTGIEWQPAEAWEREREALREQIERWRRDWESGDFSRYIAHYSEHFRTQDSDYNAWRKRKQIAATARTWARIELRELSILRDPNGADLVSVSFRQGYQSNNHNDVSHKRQYWQREAGTWKIIYEANS